MYLELNWKCVSLDIHCLILINIIYDFVSINKYSVQDFIIRNMFSDILQEQMEQKRLKV